jgi:hypothetical protein
MELLADKRVQPSEKMDEKTCDILYGKKQNERH